MISLGNTGYLEWLWHGTGVGSSTLCTGIIVYQNRIRPRSSQYEPMLALRARRSTVLEAKQGTPESYSMFSKENSGLVAGIRMQARAKGGRRLAASPPFKRITMAPPAAQSLARQTSSAFRLFWMPHRSTLGRFVKNDTVSVFWRA